MAKKVNPFPNFDDKIIIKADNDFVNENETNFYRFLTAVSGIFRFFFELHYFEMPH